MADISRNTYDKSKHYDKVILQKEVPWVDADFNETQDILRERLRDAIQWTIGSGTNGPGWRCHNDVIGPQPNNFIINEFPIIAKGFVCHKEANETYLAQADYPLAPPLTPPVSGNRQDLIYLHIYEQEISSVEDPNIVDPTLAVECCRRVKLRFQVMVLEGSLVLPNDTATDWYIELGMINRSAGVNLIASADIIDLRVLIGKPQNGETPSGTIDGSNNVFTLEFTPSPLNSAKWVKVYSDGIRIDPSQYSVAGNVLTFLPGSVNIPASNLVVDYDHL